MRLSMMTLTPQSERDLPLTTLDRQSALKVGVATRCGEDGTADAHKPGEIFARAEGRVILC